MDPTALRAAPPLGDLGDRVRGFRVVSSLWRFFSGHHSFDTAAARERAVYLHFWRAMPLRGRVRRSGFVEEGPCRGSPFKDGRWDDFVVMSCRRYLFVPAVNSIVMCPPSASAPWLHFLETGSPPTSGSVRACPLTFGLPITKHRARVLRSGGLSSCFACSRRGALQHRVLAIRTAGRCPRTWAMRWGESNVADALGLSHTALGAARAGSNLCRGASDRRRARYLLPTSALTRWTVLRGPARTMSSAAAARLFRLS